ARQLANATKTRAQMLAITPRWLITFLPWVPVEAGIYRLNKVKEREGLGEVECSPSWERDSDLPETYVDYDQTPREYFLNAVTTVLDVRTRVSDLYNQPYDQIQEQLRLLIGLGAAIDYLDRIGMANIAAYEHGLLHYATEELLGVPGLTIIGTAKEKAGVISFVLDGCRSEDAGAALDREGIAVRAGHHCAQPILRRFGLETTVRPSLALYNTNEDIDALVAALHKIQSQKSYRAN
ncbi:MAG: aminotransferase class V-fold PLP-dependent enzyme, partial [Methylocella sp.]